MNALAEEDYEFSAAELEAFDAWAAEELRMDRINRCKAAWMLLTTSAGDCAEFDLVQRITLKILCLICLALVWRGSPSDDVWNIFTMGAWDHQDDGYFWNEYVLRFNPREFRVEIIRDGDGESPYCN